MPTTPRLLTVRQYALRYGVNRATVWRWIKKGAVRVVRKGPRTGVRVEDDGGLGIQTSPPDAPQPHDQAS